MTIKEKIKQIIPLVLVLILMLVALVLAVPELYGSKEYKESKTPIETTSNGDTITIMSANVRVFTLEDKYERSWTARAPYIKKNIEKTNPDIISFQEVTRIHEDYLKTILEDYDYVLTYRDLNPIGEGCPIFYKRDRFELLDKNSFWLSETPEKMSKDKDAACYRVCSYVILKDKTTEKEIVVFNTHLDHVSDDARIRGINIILDKIKEFGFDNKASVIMGDMNAKVGSKTINALFEVFDDGYTKAINKNGVSEIHTTYQGYGKSHEDRIDFFGVSKTGITVNSYDCIDEVYSNSDQKAVYPSDHNSIVINITLK